MTKIEKNINKLAIIRDDLMGLKDSFEEKMEAIEDRAAEHDRDMTEKEEERYEALDDKAQDLDEIIDTIEEAIESLCNMDM